MARRGFAEHLADIAVADTSVRPAVDPAVGSSLDLYRADAVERIRTIKGGLSAAQATVIISGVSDRRGEAMRALDISPATLNRWIKADARLPPAESERVLGAARLLGQVEAMVEECGTPDGFDARAWLQRWLAEPLAALGGIRPLDLLDTMEGQRLVSDSLGRIPSGAYM